MSLCNMFISQPVYQVIHVQQTHAKTVAPATPEMPEDTIVSAIRLTEDHAARVSRDVHHN